jgi:hypothetical protein
MGFYLANAHGARASVNTQRCRGVVFISVVTTAGLTTGNPRTRIMFRLHSTLVRSLATYKHKYTHARSDSPVFWACILNSIFFTLSASQWSVVYNARIPRTVLSPVDSSSSFALNLLLIVCLCIYRVTPHPDSELACIHMPISKTLLIEKTLFSSSGSPFDFFRA